MENKLKWQNTKLEPVESLKNEEYEVLLKYVKDNELALTSSFANESRSDFSLTLKYGSSKMSYFESFIKEENPMYYVLFKLGELNGHLNALGNIQYTKLELELAMARFKLYKQDYPSIEPAVAESILKTLYAMPKINTLKKLNKRLNIKEALLHTTLWSLWWSGFIRFHEFGEVFYLSDSGIIVAKNLITQ